MGRIDFVGAYPVTLAATALAAVLRDRGGWPPAVHPGLSFSSRAHLASFGEMTVSFGDRKHTVRVT